MGCRLAARGGRVATHRFATHPAAAQRPAAARAPVACPGRRHSRGTGRGCGCGVRGVQVCAQYITALADLGTLMRHDLLASALAVTPRASGVGKLPGAAALIAPSSCPHRRPARLVAAALAAVALPSVAGAAHQHLALAARADESPRAGRSRHRLGHRPRCRHRHSGPSPGIAMRGAPAAQSVWTRRVAGAILHPHSWPTRWGAAAGITASHCGCRARSDTPRSSTAVWRRPSRRRTPAHSLRPPANRLAAWRGNNVQRQHTGPRTAGGWGEPPVQALVLQDTPAAAMPASHHASRG
jgi:hypothetical protein